MANCKFFALRNSLMSDVLNNRVLFIEIKPFIISFVIYISFDLPFQISKTLTKPILSLKKKFPKPTFPKIAKNSFKKINQKMNHSGTHQRKFFPPNSTQPLGPLTPIAVISRKPNPTPATVTAISLTLTIPTSNTQQAILMWPIVTPISNRGTLM